MTVAMAVYVSLHCLRGLATNVVHALVFEYCGPISDLANKVANVQKAHNTRKRHTHATAAQQNEAQVPGATFSVAALRYNRQSLVPCQSTWTRSIFHPFIVAFFIRMLKNKGIPQTEELCPFSCKWYCKTEFPEIWPWLMTHFVVASHDQSLSIKP